MFVLLLLMNWFGFSHLSRYRRLAPPFSPFFPKKSILVSSSGCSSGACLNTPLHVTTGRGKDLFNCNSLTSLHRKKLLVQLGRLQSRNTHPFCVLFPNDPPSKSHQSRPHRESVERGMEYLLYER